MQAAAAGGGRLSTTAPCPPADRIRLGDVWVDLHGRRHRAEPCSSQGLMMMVPLDDELEPLAMNLFRPYPWERLSWGGHSEQLSDQL